MPPATSVQTVPSPEVRHLQPLDGLRGVAILMVLLTHAFESNFRAHGIALQLLGSLFDAGRFGVDLFFVLSGFLITGILVDTRDDPRYFLNFFGRRALRILPLYYGVLFLLLALTPLFHWSWNGMAPLLLLYLQNLRPVAMDRLAVGPVALFHFWTLAIEEQFYLLWPLLVFALRHRRFHLIVTTALCIAAVLLLRIGLVSRGTPYLSLHMSLYARADSLLVGGLLALVYRSAGGWSRTLRYCSLGSAMFVALVLLPAVVFGVNNGPALWIEGVRYTVLAAGFAALLASSLKPRSLMRILCSHPWMRRLGTYSYGLYVLHPIVLSFARLPLRDFLEQRTGLKDFAVGVTGLTCILLSLGAAALSYSVYEKRFLGLKRHFSYTSVAPARKQQDQSRANAIA